MRKIIHIDMDAFYASIEQRDNTDLRGKPVASAIIDGGRTHGFIDNVPYMFQEG